MANGGDGRSNATATSSWLRNPRVRLALRWSILAVAIISAAISAVASARPIVAQHVGPFKVTIQHPLKGLLIAAIALHVWALAAGLSIRRTIALIGALECGVAAIFTIVATDMRWTWTGDLAWCNPVYASTLSILLIIFAVAKREPLQQIPAAAKRCGIQWKQWGWGARLVFLVFLAQAAVMGKTVAEYWTHTSLIYLRDPGTRPFLQGANGRLLPSFNHFCDTCRSKIPASARVLYHGPNQGLILAYELYPRRLFMLPAEQRVMFHDCWRNEVWCRGISPDPLYDFWKWDPPLTDISESEFIAGHRITYVVIYDEEYPGNCHIQKL